MLDDVKHAAEEPEKPETSMDGPLQIELDKVTVKWPTASEQEKNTLSDVTLTVRPGQILAVVGPVGCGKVAF